MRVSRVPCTSKIEPATTGRHLLLQVPTTGQRLIYLFSLTLALLFPIPAHAKPTLCCLPRCEVVDSGSALAIASLTLTHKRHLLLERYPAKITVVPISLHFAGTASFTQFRTALLTTQQLLAHSTPQLSSAAVFVCFHHLKAICVKRHER